LGFGNLENEKDNLDPLEKSDPNPSIHPPAPKGRQTTPESKQIAIHQSTQSVHPSQLPTQPLPTQNIPTSTDGLVANLSYGNHPRPPQNTSSRRPFLPKDVTWAQHGSKQSAQSIQPDSAGQFQSENRLSLTPNQLNPKTNPSLPNLSSVLPNKPQPRPNSNIPLSGGLPDFAAQNQGFKTETTKPTLVGPSPEDRSQLPNESTPPISIDSTSVKRVKHQTVLGQDTPGRKPGTPSPTPTSPITIEALRKQLRRLGNGGLLGRLDPGSKAVEGADKAEQMLQRMLEKSKQNATTKNRLAS
jgi:hypothetical protein